MWFEIIEDRKQGLQIRLQRIGYSKFNVKEACFKNRSRAAAALENKEPNIQHNVSSVITKNMNETAEMKVLETES